MKKFLLATTLALAATSAYADQYATKVWDVYTNEDVQIPKKVQGCHVVEIPIYETFEQKGSAAEAITGGIIGGAIGNQFGRGTGNEVMTVLGVIIGANAMDKKEQRVVGWKKEKRCSEDVIYETRKVKTYQYSVVEFYQDGKKQRLEFKK